MEKKSNPRKAKPKRVKSYLRYSNIGFQMAAAIAIGSYSGHWLDEKFNTAPWWFISLSLLGVFTALYITLKEFIGKDSGGDDQ